MRHKKILEKREVKPDIKYNSMLVAKFINYLMIDGKKSVAQHILYDALDVLTNKKQDPVSVLERAIQNVGPRQEVRPRRVGGASYQIPIEVRNDRRSSLAMRWIIQFAKERSNKEFHSMSEKLAMELLDASQNQGAAIKKRDMVHRMAQANRAFAHFRW